MWELLRVHGPLSLQLSPPAGTRISRFRFPDLQVPIDPNKASYMEEVVNYSKLALPAFSQDSLLEPCIRTCKFL
jgi:hypothetical protein